MSASLKGDAGCDPSSVAGDVCGPFNGDRLGGRPHLPGRRQNEPRAIYRPRSSNPAPPRVVLDTNLLLCALVASGVATAVLREGWQRQRFTPLASKETIRELIRVLAYPEFGLNATEQEDLLSDYLPFCATVNVSNPPPPTPICRDPCHIPFLELAMAGGADFLVTGDQDLSACLPSSCVRSLRSTDSWRNLISRERGRRSSPALWVRATARPPPSQLPILPFRCPGSPRRGWCRAESPRRRASSGPRLRRPAWSPRP